MVVLNLIKEGMKNIWNDISSVILIFRPKNCNNYQFQKHQNWKVYDIVKQVNGYLPKYNGAISILGYVHCKKKCVDFTEKSASQYANKKLFSLLKYAFITHLWTDTGYLCQTSSYVKRRVLFAYSFDGSFCEKPAHRTPKLVCTYIIILCKYFSIIWIHYQLAILSLYLI